MITHDIAPLFQEITKNITTQKGAIVYNGRRYSTTDLPNFHRVYIREGVLFLFATSWSLSCIEIVAFADPKNPQKFTYEGEAHQKLTTQEVLALAYGEVTLDKA